MFNRVWQRLRKTLLTIGKIQSALILGVFYYLILGPFALFYRFSRLFTSAPKNSKSFWIKRPLDPTTPGNVMKQY